MFLFFCFVFFFQAEDGIRDRDVTGVQSVLFRSFFLSSSFERLRLRSRGGVFVAQQIVVVEEALVSSRSRARNAAQD